MKLRLFGDKLLVERAKRTEAALRVGLLLGRLGEAVDSVTLHLSEARGAQGGSHKRCEIVISLKPDRVRTECTDADLAVAIERATARASRSIARALAWGRRTAGAAAPRAASRKAHAVRATETR